jgi:hypothetical protein
MAMDRDLFDLASQVLEEALKQSTRSPKWMRYTFPADEAFVIVQTTLQRAARSGAKSNDLFALRETLTALSELGSHAPERQLVEMVTTRLLAAGVDPGMLK